MLEKLRPSLLLSLLLIPQFLLAESGQDFLRSTGKIYVVVAVICLLFLGIVLFLVRLDSKISKLEQKLNNESKTS